MIHAAGLERQASRIEFMPADPRSSSVDDAGRRPSCGEIDHRFGRVLEQLLDDVPVVGGYGLIETFFT